MIFFQIIVFLLIFFSYVNCDQECSKTICYPRTGDLLIGRESLLRASSTCGLQDLERYCVVTLTDRGKDPKCSVCYSKDRYNKFSSPNSHRIENVVSRLPQDSGRWWQSTSGVHNTSIEVAFETEFQFIFTQLRFKTYRPAAMYIERSKDYGRTWQKSAYFSDSCSRDFKGIPERNRNDITEVSCTSEFSHISPSEGGTVIFMATPSDLANDDKDWNEKRNDITAITNLRVNFVRLHTFGDWKIDNNPNILNKYYYGVLEWIIHGRCSCYGHASRCQPKEGQMQRKEMVYGVCVCQHNTMGQHCEKCKDFYNDKPWLPAEVNKTNECKKCDCYSHSTSCHFDPVVFDLSGKKNGGVCDNCQHNTEGKNCERCISGYYRNTEVILSSEDTCLKCKCDPHGTIYPNLCIQETEKEQGLVAGSCMCKENVDGYYCNKCKIGYWNFDKNNEKGCSKCKCLMMGTTSNEGCDYTSGQCFCKTFVEGPLCDICKNGYYNLSAQNPLGCSPCGCDQRGSVNSGKCDKSNGQCHCKNGYIGTTCNQIKAGWFIDSPRYALRYGENINIKLPSVSKSGYYNFIITMDTQQMLILDTYVAVFTIDHDSKSACSSYQDSISITKDSKKILVPNKCLVQDLPIVINVFLISPSTDQSQPPTVIDIVVVPMLFANSTATRELLAKCLKYSYNSMPAECNFLKVEPSSRAIAVNEPKVCGCNVTGSMNNVCNSLGGQCNCLSNVVGRKCDQCDINSYGFDARGCKNCDCEPKGSLNLQCASDTGKCLCRKGVEGRHCDYCKTGFWKFPFCESCKCNSLADICDQKTGHCTNCRGNSFGFNCQQCNNGFYGDPSKGLPCLKCDCPGLSLNLNHSVKCSLIFNTTSYMCVCKPGYKGIFCDECDDNYFGNPREKTGRCSPCHCSSNIDKTVPGSCDKRTGECKKCLYNTAGFNCEKCAIGYYGIGVSRTCKKCVCNSLGTNLNTVEKCHHETGKCPCLPNVLGQQCDKCLTGFFNISSGKGCLPCACDSSNGAINETCNSLSGQCHCRESRSGRQCDKCEDGYWGDPRQNHGCKVCLCNLEGSLFYQCDRNNGACRCKPGITGRYCDRCARGTDGKMPNCSTCGDCWLQWDQTIEDILVSLGQIQNGTRNNMTIESLPKDLLAIVTNINRYVDSTLSIMKYLPDDLKLQLTQFKADIDFLRGALSEVNVTDFDVNEFDSTNITKAISDMNEMVENNKIQDSKGAYNMILKSLKSIIDSINQSLEAVKLIQKMKKIVSDQEKEINLINMEHIEKKSKDLADLEQTLTGNLNKFNKVTCNSGSSVNSSLCSDICGGVGCEPNNCSRTAAVIKQCLGDESLMFFNAHALKINSQKILNLNDIEKILQKDISGKFNDTKKEIDNAKVLIGVTNSTINSKYEKCLKLLESLKNIANNSISEEEFKRLLDTIHNFKLTSHEEEIKIIENKIKNRIQQLNDKVNDILAKSMNNRKECDVLKKKSIEAKENANNLLKSIKDMEENRRMVFKIQSQTKAVLLNFSIYDIEIKGNLSDVLNNQNNNQNNHRTFDQAMQLLTSLTQNIESIMKTLVDEILLLDAQQINMTVHLDEMKIRTDKAILKKEFLSQNIDKMKIENDDKHKMLSKKIEDLYKKIDKTRAKISNVRQSVELKRSKMLELSEKVEEKVKRVSSLESEMYAKSEFQRSCLP